MSDRSSNTSVGCGSIGLGNVIAVIISWSLYHSILWALIHGFFGWLYIIYYLFTHGL